MTTTTTFRPGSAEHRTWLLSCAERLRSEGQHQLADEATAEADALLALPAVPASVTHLPCEDCGRPASVRRMPQDWPLDWWSHARNGRPCREARAN